MKREFIYILHGVNSMNVINEVKECYDNNVLSEWNRLERHPIEFEINMRYIKKYIKDGDCILDIGGGPGRYSLTLAEKGYDVTLFDLSQGNVAFASQKASEMNLSLKTVCGDACHVDKLINGLFDIILLMGPLYHLPNEDDRVRAVNAALRLLKPGGFIFIAFISSMAAVWDYLANIPQAISNENEKKYFDIFEKDKDFSGLSFTQSYFIRPKDIESFMSRFPLEKKHILGSESVLALRENELISQPKEILSAWIDFAEKVCEKEEFLYLPHHLLYIGNKI